MTENLIAAGFLLLSGALIIGKFRSGGKSAVWWIGLTALVVGPLLAFAYHQLDVYWLNRDFYVTSEERNESLRPTLMLGFFGGLGRIKTPPVRSPREIIPPTFPEAFP
jgi:hypothetical protein